MWGQCTIRREKENMHVANMCRTLYQGSLGIVFPDTHSSLLVGCDRKGELGAVDVYFYFIFLLFLECSVLPRKSLSSQGYQWCLRPGFLHLLVLLSSSDRSKSLTQRPSCFGVVLGSRQYFSPSPLLPCLHFHRCLKHCEKNLEWPEQSFSSWHAHETSQTSSHVSGCSLRMADSRNHLWPAQDFVLGSEIQKPMTRACFFTSGLGLLFSNAGVDEEWSRMLKKCMQVACPTPWKFCFYWPKVGPRNLHFLYWCWWEKHVHQVGGQGYYDLIV